MSIARCDACCGIIDTDFDLECYDVDESRCICEACRERDYFVCEHCNEFKPNDDRVDDELWCIGCAESQADLMHDMALER